MKQTLCYFFILTSLLFNFSLLRAETEVWLAPEAELVKSNPIRFDAESVASGKTLFTVHCLNCHGYWGEGNGIIGLTMDSRPANLLQIAGEQTQGDFAWKIAEGRNNMPSFRSILTESEIWHLVNFISSLENEMGSSAQSIVVKRCAYCHGMAGKAFHSGWKDLAQMNQQEIEALLFAHRKGEAGIGTMSTVAFDLTDEEIREAAIYYSSLKIPSDEQQDKE